MPFLNKTLSPTELAAFCKPHTNPLAVIEVLYKSACEGVVCANMTNRMLGLSSNVYHNHGKKGFSLPLPELSTVSLSNDYTSFMGIFCGPNGSGKTTTADTLINDIPDLPPKLNADELTARLRLAHPLIRQDELNLRAAQQTDDQVRAYIQSGKSFFVETVLSSPKYREDVINAKKKGYCIIVAFFSVVSPEINIDRVRIRVLKGGHDVPRERIVSRSTKSHEQFAWFAKRANILCAIDNSVAGGPPSLVAYGLPELQSIHHAPGINPEIDRVIGVLQNKQPSQQPTL